MKYDDVMISFQKWYKERIFDHLASIHPLAAMGKRHNVNNNKDSDYLT
ncbi:MULTISPECIES: hypothetical protein [unclassified Candidatus Tisiphia]